MNPLCSCTYSFPPSMVLISLSSACGSPDFPPEATPPKESTKNTLSNLCIHFLTFFSNSIHQCFSILPGKSNRDRTTISLLITGKKKKNYMGTLNYIVLKLLLCYDMFFAFQSKSIFKIKHML